MCSCRGRGGGDAGCHQCRRCPSRGRHCARNDPLPLRRRLHERALAYVGADWNAHAVWDLALRAKRVLSDSRALAALYARVLAVPLRDLERYHRE